MVLNPSRVACVRCSVVMCSNPTVFIVCIICLRSARMRDSSCSSVVCSELLQMSHFLGVVWCRLCVRGRIFGSGWGVWFGWFCVLGFCVCWSVLLFAVVVASVFVDVDSVVCFLVGECGCGVFGVGAVVGVLPWLCVVLSGMMTM